MAQDYKSQRDEEIAIKTTRHQSLVKPGTSKHPDKNNENTIDVTPIETVPVRQSRASKSISHSKSSAAEAFRIVSVVFVVFVIAMTAQSMVGIFLLFIHVPKSIRFGCGVLAITAVITDLFMYAFLLRDFRNMNVPVVSHNKYTNTSLHVTHIAVKRMLI